MKTVHILMSMQFDGGYNIEAVFSTKEKAEAYMKLQEVKETKFGFVGYIDEYTVDEEDNG